jgi:hypothetical protein
VRYIFWATCVVAVNVTSSIVAWAGSPISYLKGEAHRIQREGDRIKSEASLMRSESFHLKLEASDLRDKAAQLDDLWAKANHADPKRYSDYPGRNRSQERMRLDAKREDQDSDALRAEEGRLGAEAERLWKLAAAVNAQAQEELLKRMMCCRPQKSEDIEFLRTEIIRMARALGTNYTPSANSEP